MRPRLPRSRNALAAAGVVVIVAAVAVTAAVLRIGGASPSSLNAGAVPGVTATPAPGPCLDATQARTVWNDVARRLDALALHPDTTKVGDVAEGTAADQLRAYLQQTLIDKNLHEREQERLDDITVLQAGCNGQPLTIHATETLVHDDYLAADGHVDHVDSGVGHTNHLLESYVRSGSTWKVIVISPLDQPTASGNFV